jgi:uncharacterized protein YggU (UPF0235/DUF167 family)
MKIFVKVKPNSKIEKIEKIKEAEFTLWVNAPAKEGKANQEVIELLSRYFDTFGDKPQCLTLGNQSYKPEGLKKAGDLSLSVSTLSIPEIKYSKHTPMLVIGVYECVDIAKSRIVIIKGEKCKNKMLEIL